MVPNRATHHKWTLFQKYKVAFSLKTAVYKDMIFVWLSPAMRQLLEKRYFEFLHALNFSCTWRKEFSYCRLQYLWDSSHYLKCYSLNKPKAVVSWKFGHYSFISHCLDAPCGNNKKKTENNIFLVIFMKNFGNVCRISFSSI